MAPTSDTQNEDLAFWRSMPWWPEGREAHIYAGVVGHDREIVVNIEGYGHGRDEVYIPTAIIDALKLVLPEGWKLENRGSRVEIHPSGRFAGGFSDADVDEVGRALGELGLVLSGVTGP